jgi:hypothetical protein
MFRIEGTEWDNMRLFEPESETSVVLTGTSRRLSVKVFLMIRGDVRAPFEVRVNHGMDPETGEEYRYYTFDSFGHLSVDGPGHHSLEAESEELWKQKAAAALVVFGRHYNGLDTPPSRNRVFLDGRLYTRLDFGFDR